jgi:Kef-type K+ transport system membrane component KefB
MQELFSFAQADSFYEFALILGLAALLGIVGLFFRQPLIVMFIALGVIAGPSFLNIVRSKDKIHLLAEIGISILLFIVGLKLDLRIIKSLGKIALMTGLGQVIFTSLIGYFIALALGLAPLHGFYVAVALTFSSTIIIVKLLSDKREIDSLHGQISIGFLIVQDIVVILVMIILSAMQKSGSESLTADILRIFATGVGLLAFALLSMRYLIPTLCAFLAKSQELLTLFAIAWAVIFAMVAELLGFSGEVGAFLAGVSLASSEYKEIVSGRLVSLRDFLLLFFFVNLGAELNLNTIGSQIFPAMVFSVFVLIGNPLIVLVIMGFMGYRKRTAFLAGLTVAQISEFSLIFAGLGLSVGHITEEIVGLVTLVGLITIGLSTYLILYSHSIYEFLSPFLSIFERKSGVSKDFYEGKSKGNFDVIVFGIGRFGSKITELLSERPHIRTLGVDFDPVVVRDGRQSKKPYMYADAEDPDLAEHIPLAECKIVISTIPNFTATENLVKSLKNAGYKGKIYITAANERDFALLSECGAEKVLQIHHLAATNFFNGYLAKTLDEEFML